LTKFSELNHLAKHDAANAYIASLKEESIFSGMDDLEAVFIADMREYIDGHAKLRPRLRAIEGTPRIQSIHE